MFVWISVHGTLMVEKGVSKSHVGRTGRKPTSQCLATCLALSRPVSPCLASCLALSRPVSPCLACCLALSRPTSFFAQTADGTTDGVAYTYIAPQWTPKPRNGTPTRKSIPNVQLEARRGRSARERWQNIAQTTESPKSSICPRGGPRDKKRTHKCARLRRPTTLRWGKMAQ